MPKPAVLLFLLMLFLIAVVYYVGTSSDILAGARGLQIFGNTFTGRNAAGTFGGYPNSNAAVFVPNFG